MKFFSRFVFLSISILATFSSIAEERAWRSSDGERSIAGTLLSSDSTNITLRRSDGRVITFPIAKLHLDDQAYLKANHTPGTETEEAELVGNAYGPLAFGDNRTQVEKKLSESSFVKTDVDKTLFGRVGLNGIFYTTETIGGLHCFLYFDWNEGGGLKEVTLRTKPLAKSKYNTKLRSTWSDLLNLVNLLHGKPLSHSEYPNQSELQDGLILNSHLWRTNEGNSVLLGTAQDNDDYSVCLRFTSERIQPVRK